MPSSSLVNGSIGCLTPKEHYRKGRALSGAGREWTRSPRAETYDAGARRGRSCVCDPECGREYDMSAAAVMVTDYLSCQHCVRDWIEFCSILRLERGFSCSMRTLLWTRCNFACVNLSDDGTTARERQEGDEKRFSFAFSQHARDHSTLTRVSPTHN